MAVSQEEVRRALAREYIGEEYDRLCKRYGETTIVSAFFDNISVLSKKQNFKDLRRSMKRLRKKRKWRTNA
jgi:hypothetical protein